MQNSLRDAQTGMTPKDPQHTARDQYYGPARDFRSPPEMPSKAGRVAASIYIWGLSCANLALILVVLILISRWQQLSGTERLLNAAQPAAVKNQDPPVDVDALNPCGQAVAKAGLTHCAIPMNNLSTRLLAGKKVGIYRFPVMQNNFASFSMEIAAQDGGILYLTLDASQNADGSCQIAYEAVSDWANSCADVVKTVFKDFVPTRNLLKSVVLLTHKENKNRKIFTMPVQNGCIAIEKELVSTYK